MEESVMRISAVILTFIIIVATMPTAARPQNANVYTTIPNPCAGTPGISKMAASGNQIYVVCQGLEASPIIVLQNQEPRQ